MRKVTHIISIALLTLGIFTTSCKEDFLDNQIKSRLTDDIQWASEGQCGPFPE
jgi:hypothetical protein